jgi:hypothetical protein
MIKNNDYDFVLFVRERNLLAFMIFCFVRSREKFVGFLVIHVLGLFDRVISLLKVSLSCRELTTWLYKELYWGRISSCYR